ncbi:epoxide hydrolase family protein [Granulicella tundricola]|uniref:Epoxide hydrolase domain protein n=1 Tax=Granulicella tundricola (strain ATCC BAA-1859 / DSM 23138 / MP5ACTX9) TaxID=1198114 RepID=E8X790_GRATM|nr:epoxide hydrolase family protein [Granulicella tundricola]ADW71324.1 Epoxide hydrolase domain protein [Granulicella tundricola MP5ACTX9]
MTPIEPFSPTFSSDHWEDLRSRIKQTRWPDEIPGSDWGSGFELQSLKDLCRYWSEDFDWQKQIDRLSQFPHFRFKSDQGKIHFLHVKGRGPAAIPLILTHGWPGSFLEMLEIVPLLTNPVAHGLAADISFDVVIPSLPGFGFSDRPQSEGVNSFRVAEIWVELMRALGYDRFAAQGGDIGAGVSTALGLRHSEHLIGVHLNYIPGSYKPYLAPGTEITPAERQFQAEAAQWYDENGAYAHMQGTRPQTPAYALNDSPAGLAAWMLEKFREWSDCGGDLYSSFSRDALLANVTLYWMTQTISSSFHMYREGRRSPLHFSSTDYVPTPCAIACFPKEIMMPPRSWVERGYNVTRWTPMPKGGHFAAAEEPELLASDLQAFFGTVRT